MRLIPSAPRSLAALLLLAGLFTFLFCKRSAPDAARASFCSIGSAEMNMIMDHWAAGFAALRPEGPPGTEAQLPPGYEDAAPAQAGPRHEGRGNGVGPQALLKGTCDMAPMSRKMTDAEVHAFVERYGAEPLAVPVAVDALALVVPSEYPINVISPDDVFHAFHLGPEKVRNLQAENADGVVRAFGVNSASERYRWFKQVALHDKKFSDRVIEVADPLRLVTRINSDGGIGYARLAEIEGDLKTLRIDMGFGKIVELTPANARSGLYPYTRFLYIYLPPPGRPVDLRTLTFIQYILAPEGQDLLASQGLFTLARKEQIYNANRLDAYTEQAVSTPE